MDAIFSTPHVSLLHPLYLPSLSPPLLSQGSQERIDALLGLMEVPEGNLKKALGDWLKARKATVSSSHPSSAKEMSSAWPRGWGITPWDHGPSGIIRVLSMHTDKILGHRWLFTMLAS